MNRRDLFFWPVLCADMLAQPEMSKLSPEAMGAFFRLCCHAWMGECKLPANDAELRRLVGCHSARQWQKIRSQLAGLVQKSGESHVIPMITECYKEAQRKHNANKEKGQKMAEKRWGDNAKGNAVSNTASNTNRERLEREKERETQQSKSKASLSVRVAPAQPLPQERAPIAGIVANILEGIKQPEHEPEPEPDVQEALKLESKFQGYSTADLLRYTVTANRNGELPAQLNCALGTIADEVIRRECIELLATKPAMKWSPAKKAEKLSAKLKGGYNGER